MAKSEQTPYQITLQQLPEIDIETFRPKGNRLLIKPIVIENKIGSVIIAEQSSDQASKVLINRGVVVSIGSEVLDKEIKPGAVVMFYRAASEGGLRQGQQEYLLMCEYNILADIIQPVKTVGVA